MTMGRRDGGGRERGQEAKVDGKEGEGNAKGVEAELRCQCHRFEWPRVPCGCGFFAETFRV